MKTTQGTAAFQTMYRKKRWNVWLSVDPKTVIQIYQPVFVHPMENRFFSLSYPLSKWYLFELTYSSSPSGQIIDHALFILVSMAHQSLSTLANIIPCSSRDYHNCSLGIETNCVVHQQQQQQKSEKCPTQLSFFDTTVAVANVATISIRISF